jgi:hypothetical protein
MDAASQFSITEQKLAQATQHAHSKTWIDALGINVSRYGLVLTLPLIGALTISLQPVRLKAFSNFSHLLFISRISFFWVHRSGPLQSRRCAISFCQVLF